MRSSVRRLLVAAAAVVLAAGCGAPTPVPSASPTATPTSTAPTSATPTAPTTPAPTTSAPSPTPTTSAPTPTATSPRPTVSPTTPHPTPTRTPTPTPTTTGIPASLLGQDVRVIPTERHVVALTFDGGANDAGLARILATLRAEGVRATFFLTGRFVTTYPDDARAIVAAGHVVGNHTMTHPHSTQITDAELAAEVREGATTIRSATGRSPVPWFRFPFGERTVADIRLLNGLGYVCVSWTVDTLGWLGEERGTASDVTTRVLAQLRPGEIVLMHLGSNPNDGTTFDADALGATIRALRARGYGFVTVEELLRAA